MMQIKHHYSCIGCGKEYNTYKEYPHGWICVDCRKTAKITLKCSECGSDFQVNWDTYRMKDPNIPWRCRSCNDKYRNALYDAKPEEEKKAFVARQAARTKKYWANLSDEARSADSERRKDLWKERKENGEGQKILDAMKEGRANWWNSLTDDQKKHQWDYMNDGRALWWESLSQEERDLHMSFPHKGFTAWFNSLSEERQREFMEPIHDGNKKFWDGMSPEQFQRMRFEFCKGYRECADETGITPTTAVPNKNESAFIGRIMPTGIKYMYQYPSLELHPEFNQRFQSNMVTGGDLVDPYHFWDFVLLTRDGKVLVDVDGSVHNPARVTTGYTKFNDSKRPYQTDGLPAYIIQCYDDNLTDNTPVEDVATGKKMTLQQWIGIIKWMNMTDDERRQVVNAK